MNAMKTRGRENHERRLIVTADDFGLSGPINRGIIRAHREGVVTATALLVNAPATDEAVELAKEVPSLQVGIHLGIVEGYALTGGDSSIADRDSYFGDGRACLHRHWRPFVLRYACGLIRLRDLELEFEAQIQRFISLFPSMPRIPFLNSTQHLHILPGISGVVIRLCRKYGIRNIRVPHKLVREPSGLARGAISVPYRALGSRFARQCRRSGIQYPDYFAGFMRCGHQSPDSLSRMSGCISAGTTELMLHPGFEDDALRRNLPWAYSTFDWSGELAAACAPGFRRELESSGISLGSF